MKDRREALEATLAEEEGNRVVRWSTFSVVQLAAFGGLLTSWSKYIMDCVHS